MTSPSHCSTCCLYAFSLPARRAGVPCENGVSYVEFALAEKEFIYSRNRLNVSITRARGKTVLLVSRALLEPPIQALDDDDVADGIAYMQGLVHWCIAAGGVTEYSTLGGRLTLLRA